MYAKVKNLKKLEIKFHAAELREFTITGMTYTVGKGKNARLFVNVSLPWLTWETHAQECAKEVLDALKLAAKWQGDLQGKQPTINSHAHPATIQRDNGLLDRKVRFPVFATTSEPYVQYVRDENGERWDVQGYFFSDSLPGIGAYYAALRQLADEVATF